MSLSVCPEAVFFNQEAINQPDRSWLRKEVRATDAASPQLMSWLALHHFPRRQTDTVARLGQALISVFARLECLFAQLLFSFELISFIF